MEDVLDLYAQTDDPKRPRVCFDERPVQLLGDTKIPTPAKPGQARRVDYEYERLGTCNLFTFLEPNKGWRHIKVTDRRTAIDFAHCMKDLVDIHYPEAELIRITMDNLNTHTPAALYQAFHPEEARRILKKLEFHYTPKHGSWLNMAEIELSVLSRQCLNRRIPNQEVLKSEIAAWSQTRNQEKATVKWRFTNDNARVKLQKLYPKFSQESDGIKNTQQPIDNSAIALAYAHQN
jgi:DDE superfamily endonuclease